MSDVAKSLDIVPTLSLEADCQMLHELILQSNERVMDTFKFFIQLASLLLGGVVYLDTLTPAPADKATYVLLSDWLAIFMAGTTLAIVFLAKRSWWGYRKKLSRRAGTWPNRRVRLIPGPRAKFVIGEMVIASAVIIATGFFCWFNPLQS